MKKRVLIFCFALVACKLFSKEIEIRPFYSAVSLEANMNSYDRVAAGVGFENFYSFANQWKGGVSVKYSSDFDQYNSLELLVNAGKILQKSLFNDNVKIYVGLVTGYEQIWKDSDCANSLSIGGEGKLFFEIYKTETMNLNLIPFARIGFPYVWSLGIGTGVMF